MSTIVGIVGPVDLVDSVAALCEQSPGVSVVRCPYAHETDAPALVRDHSAQVDAWLFTGIVPYTLAGNASPRPSAFVDYTRETVLEAWVRLASAGRDIARTSIDTVRTTEIRDLSTAVGIDPAAIRSVAYRPDIDSAQLIAFHRANPDPTWSAITCVSSVHEALRDEMTIIRLAPSPHAVRTALHQLLLATTNQIHEDAQVVLGLVDAAGAADSAVTERLAAEVSALAGTLSRTGDGTYLLVTTRGALAGATNDFTDAPFLRRFEEASIDAYVGFGLGRTAAEAERLARRALNRAHAHKGPAAVAAFRNDIDLLLASGGRQPGGDETGPPAIGVIAARVGLSAATLGRLQQLWEGGTGAPITSRVVAAELGVQLRTARRMLQRLEYAGYAERAGIETTGSTGRPRTQYLLRL
ncbi:MULTISPECIES: hypothetical protein [Polymorphospora]|uniref:Transcriptional regulator n=1 Tax=Polymorphospora lycopeni TaxID=3140240 RepID=A0ABV5CW47_9ACTN